MTYDAVVIGSGPNGLAGANLLADAGWSVLVLEAAPTPGGAVRSDALMEPGFVNDVFSAFYPMAAASPILAGFELERHGLRWRHAPLVLAHPSTDGTCPVLSRDLDETVESLNRFQAGDGDTWRHMHARWRRLREPIIDALFTPFPPIRALGKLAWLERREPLEALRVALMSVRRFGDEHFRSEPVRRLLTGLTAHTDLAPDAALGAVYGLLLALVGQDDGFPVPEGGAGQLTTALVSRLQSRGATVRCNTRVEQVVVTGGRASGVRTDGGETIEAARAVLADVDAVALFTQLLSADHVPPRVRRALDRFEREPATVKLDWNLDAPVPWTAPAARRAGTVHLADSTDAITTYNADIAAGRLPARPFVLLGQQSMTDPTRQPGGAETVWAYSHVPQGVKVDGSLLGVFADRVQAEIERHAPGFGALVRHRHVLGPADLEARNANLVGGAIGGGTAQLHQQVVFRPYPGLGRATTAIRNLYLASASAHPGPGVHGACGANAARAALADARFARRTR